MKVYHSSTCIVEKPDVLHSRDFLDFGKGFYLTTLKEQAVKYAERFLLRGKKAYLNEYELRSIVESFKIKRFDSYDEEWLDFVMKCRKNNDTSTYDIIIGGIANDKVFRTIDLYFSGDITKDEALRKLKYEKPNNQLCLRTQTVIDECLEFVKSEEL